MIAADIPSVPAPMTATRFLLIVRSPNGGSAADHNAGSDGFAYREGGIGGDRQARCDDQAPRLPARNRDTRAKPCLKTAVGLP